MMEYPLTIKDPLFTEENTKVVAVAPKKFNAHHHYEVQDLNGNCLSKIDFQEGPIKENGVNGVFAQDLILMIIDRLRDFQKSEYACEENETTINYLEAAIRAQRERTNKRKERGVEGTSAV